MTRITEIRRNVAESTPLLAVVGATDYAVERVRAAAKDASHLQVELTHRVQALEKVPSIVEERVRSFDPKAVQAAPSAAVARALETAGRVEQSYEKLAVRGKELLDRVGRQQATQDLLKQGRATLTRTRAAVTTARKAVDDTTAAALHAVHFGRSGASETVSEVADSVAATEKVVQERAQATRVVARRTATTARKRAVGVRTAAKGVATSVRKTAAQAVEAAGEAAAVVGQDPAAETAEKPAEAAEKPAE